MSRLSDTQLIILSAASQRDDRGVELPATVKDEAARKAVDKLIRAGLLGEVRRRAPPHLPRVLSGVPGAIARSMPRAAWSVSQRVKFIY